MDKKKIRSLRESLGLDWDEFAKRLGVSWRTVKGWENGRKPNPSARAMLKQIAATK